MTFLYALLALYVAIAAYITYDMYKFYKNEAPKEVSKEFFSSPWWFFDCLWGGILWPVGFLYVLFGR